MNCLRKRKQLRKGSAAYMSSEEHRSGGMSDGAVGHGRVGGMDDELSSS
jgi:hypothetical protein